MTRPGPAGVGPKAKPSIAGQQLERILYILPAASRDGGIALKRLAKDLDVTEDTLLNDLAQVLSRSFYHPADTGSEIQVAVERGRVSVFTTGEFRRPACLSLEEALCLAIALRQRRVEGRGRMPFLQGNRVGDDGGDPGPVDLLSRLEGALVRPEAYSALEKLELQDLRPDPLGVRETLAQCIAARYKVTLTYLKPESQSSPESRKVRPYALAHAEGRWYLLAHCEKARAVRVFRLDRVLAAVPSHRRFRRPRDFQPEEHLRGGRIYVVGEVCHVRVWYSPKIAPWIVEREEGQLDFDGGVTVHWRVVDPGWLVRHVLQYGPEAEVLSPPEAREWVKDTLKKILEAEGRPWPPPLERDRPQGAGIPTTGKEG